MQLLTLEEIYHALKVTYYDSVNKYPSHFLGFIPSIASDEQLHKVANTAHQLGVKLPASFLEMLTVWNLGLLNIANFRFGKSGDFGQELVKKNSDKCCPGWWEDQDQYTRPPSQLMIAQSDPYVALLDCDTGEILAYVAVEGAMSAEVVASDITTFIRGLGTIEILTGAQEDINAWCNEIRNLVGDKSSRIFWWENINHWAKQ